MLSQASTKFLVFIDPAVDDYQSLVKGVVANADVIVLDSQRDGVEQITEALRDRPTPESIHIVSHGSPGALYLGNSQLNLRNLAHYADDLAGWAAPQLLLYGCNVAAGDAGSEFIETLSTLTGAAIAASTSPIGNAALGGNWQLDVTRGDLEASLVFSTETVTRYPGLLINIETPAGDGQVKFTTLEANGDVGDVDYDYFAAGRPLSSLRFWRTLVRFGSSGARTELKPIASTFATSTAAGGTSNSFSVTNNGQTLNVTVTQELEDKSQGGVRTGGQLKQVYTFSNSSGTAVDLEFFRWFDIDLSGSGSIIDDGGGREVIGGEDWLFQTDVPVDANTATELVGITVQGGNELAAGQFEVSQYSALLSKLKAGGNLSNTVQGDGADVDQLVDLGAGSDIAVAKGKGLTVNAGSSASLTVYSIFGNYALNQVSVGSSAPDLADASDTGISITDNITADNTPTFTGIVQAGNSVNVYDAGTLMGAAVVDGSGNWTFTNTSALADGVHNITTIVTSGGVASAPSTALAVTIDSTAPTAPGTAPDLAALSDTGLSNTDNLTSDTTPTFVGAPNSGLAGDTITLYEGSTILGTGTIAANGSWSVTTSTLGNGVHNISATFRDLAGNESAQSSALSITISSTAPAAPASAPDLETASDTGASNTDDLTNVTTPTFVGAPNSGTAGQIVTL